MLSFTLLHLFIIEIQTCTRSQLCAHEIALSAFYLISLSIFFIFPFSSDTHLSFEFPCYYVSEQGARTGVYRIYIIKELLLALMIRSSRVSGFCVGYPRRSFAEGSTDKATEGVDFYAPETHLAIKPSKEKHPYFFQIINDDIIEGLEN